MNLTISNAARTAMGNAFIALLDAGGGPGYIEVRTDVQPTVPSEVASGDVLATFTLDLPAFGPFGSGFSTGISVLGTVAPVVATGTGIPGWFRAYDNTGDVVMDGDVGDVDSEATLRLSSLNIVAGGDVSIDSGALTMPYSATAI